MPADSGDSRNIPVSPTCSVVMLRRSGAFFSTQSRMSLNPPTAIALSVRIGPAEMQLTRIPFSPSSIARYRLVASSAAFATPITL